MRVFKNAKNLMDNQFWINKFENDQLSIERTHDNLKDWIQEYNKTYQAKKKAIDFVNLLYIEYEYLLKEHISYRYINAFNLKAKIYHIKDIKSKLIFNLLPLELKQQIDESSMNNSSEQHLIIILDQNKVFSIEYFIVPKIQQYWYDVTEFKYQLTDQALIDFLFNLFYYIPDIDIKDSEELSYFIKTHPKSPFLNGKPIELLTNRIDYWNNV